MGGGVALPAAQLAGPTLRAREASEAQNAREAEMPNIEWGDKVRVRPDAGQDLISSTKWDEAKAEFRGRHGVVTDIDSNGNVYVEFQDSGGSWTIIEFGKIFLEPAPL